MREAHQLKTSTIQRAKKVTFSNFLMFMEDKVSLALSQIVKEQLKELGYRIDQLFFAIYVKNNKLTGICWAYIQIIYYAKYKISNKKS